MKATIVPDEIPVRYSFREGFGHYLTIDVPNGWDDVKKLVRKALKYEGRKYAFIGWNSDRNEMFFRGDIETAQIVKGR